MGRALMARMEPIKVDVEVEVIRRTRGADQAKAMADRMFADMMSAAGVDSKRAALQILYYLPEGFIRAYEELFDRALRINGETTPAGDSAGALGKAPSGTSGSKGNKTQLRGGAGKKFKNIWTIADEDALELKGRIDKRLRALARDIEVGLEEGMVGEEDQRKILGKFCPGAGCGKRLKPESDSFCAACGSRLLFLDKNRQVN